MLSPFGTQEARSPCLKTAIVELTEKLWAAGYHVGRLETGIMLALAIAARKSTVDLSGWGTVMIEVTQQDDLTMTA